MQATTLATIHITSYRVRVGAYPGFEENRQALFEALANEAGYGLCRDVGRRYHELVEAELALPVYNSFYRHMGVGFAIAVLTISLAHVLSAALEALERALLEPYGYALPIPAIFIVGSVGLAAMLMTMVLKPRRPPAWPEFNATLVGQLKPRKTARGYEENRGLPALNKTIYEGVGDQRLVLRIEGPEEAWLTQHFRRRWLDYFTVNPAKCLDPPLPFPVGTTVRCRVHPEKRKRVWVDVPRHGTRECPELDRSSAAPSARRYSA